MVNRLPLALVISVLCFANVFAARPQDALQAAAKQGRPALLLVTGPEAQGVDSARATVSAAAKLIKGCVTVELDRSDAANAPFVASYRLVSAPVPVILVFASNGSLAGGVVAARTSPPAVASMIPTPKKAEVLQALQSGNAVFIVVSRKGMKENAKVMENCALARGQVKGKATIVQVDLGDAAEQRFLGELRVDTAVDAPETIAVNAQGQLTGAFSGVADAVTLAQAATKQAAGCCSAGSSAKSCPPPKG
jgi:hypothetical protein